MIDVNLGDIVTMPAGRKGQVQEIRIYWKDLYPGSRFGKRRVELLINTKPWDGKREKFWLAEYMVSKVEPMSASASAG